MPDPQNFLDHRALDWTQVQRATVFVRQTLEYRYPGPIADLRQRLMLIPRQRHGGQRLVSHLLAISAPGATVRGSRDRFGNRLHHIAVPEVAGAIRFEASFTVEQHAPVSGVQCSAAAARHFLAATPLTAADDRLRAAVRELRAEGDSDIAMATEVAAWVRRAISYTPGATSVHTAAWQALAQGKGVCQDFAHIMLALCRLRGLPARYVSGHRLGEGHTHAWVEVIVRDPALPSGFRAVPFDPTRGRPVDLTYISVAMGRDYRDVPPTTGSFRAPFGGRLHATKSARVVGVTMGESG